MSWTEANAVAKALLAQGRVEEAVAQWSALAAELGKQDRWWEARGIGRTLVSVTEGADWQLRGAALYVMAEMSRGAGELAEAGRWAHRALAVHEQARAARAAAADWVFLGELGEERGDLDEAVACWERALALLDEQDSAEVVHELLLGLGAAHSELQRWEQAAECIARAERLSARWAA
jgi:tetratricopeptide (TPR) repeat protein